MSKRNEITIWCVDPEERFWKSIREMCSNKFKIKHFPELKKCLSALCASNRGVLIFDLALLDDPQLDNLFNICRMSSSIQVIVTGANVCIAQVVEFMKQGLYDFVPKPFHLCDLMNSIISAVNTPKVKFMLSISEEKVLALILEGKISKEIAFMLNRSVRTIEVHRQNISKKLNAKNRVDLLKLGSEYFADKAFKYKINRKIGNDCWEEQGLVGS